jgi:glutaredoxin
MRFLVAALLAVFAACAAAQVYTWKDKDGKVHYGDRPPAEVKTEEVKIRSYDTPSPPQDWSKVLRAKAPTAAAAQGVTMYMAEWCGVCRRARSYFAANRIAYTEIDIEKSDAGRREFQALGGRGVPLIVADGKVMRGFSPEGFQRLRQSKP